MCSRSQARILVATAMLVFAVSLPAQRYYGRDHHLYHPPAQAKQQTTQPANSRARQASTTAANTSAHNTSAPGTQKSAEHSPVSNSKPDSMTPPPASERQPQ